MKARFSEQFPFMFNLGQRVRCAAGRLGTVRYRWNTDIDAIYLVEFDGDHTAVEIGEAEMRPEMGGDGSPSHEPLTTQPFKFDVGQKVKVLTGEAGTVLQRWHSLIDAKYLVRRDGDLIPMQFYESELRDIPKTPFLWETA